MKQQKTKIIVSPPDEVVPAWMILINGEIVYECETEKEAWYYVLGYANNRMK